MMGETHGKLLWLVKLAKRLKWLEKGRAEFMAICWICINCCDRSIIKGPLNDQYVHEEWLHWLITVSVYIQSWIVSGWTWKNVNLSFKTLCNWRFKISKNTSYHLKLTTWSLSHAVSNIHNIPENISCSLGIFYAVYSVLYPSLS